MRMADRDVLNGQRSHWQTVLTEHEDLFGLEPSKSAIKALETFRGRGITRILEIGAGQGRDTLYFAENGLKVHVLDYTDTAVETILKKAEELGFSGAITAEVHDVRKALPFEEDVFEGCYSHMLYCMAFTTQELQFLSGEIRRILKPGGINIFTARTTKDSHYGTGIHRGEGMYEVGGFIVHFFDRELIKKLSQGLEIVDIQEFEEGGLPRILNIVTQEKV